MNKQQQNTFYSTNYNRYVDISPCQPIKKLQELYANVRRQTSYSLEYTMMAMSVISQVQQRFI